MPGWPGIDGTRAASSTRSWPEDLDYDGKRMVVMAVARHGDTRSGFRQATAHVTMLRRSPTTSSHAHRTMWQPSWNRRLLPVRLALRVIHWKNVLLGMYFYNLSRRRPDRVKQEILRLVREQLGPDYDVEKHFTPRYNPWDRRLCVVPDADLFVAIRSGKTSVVTDEIETFAERGIRLKSGDELQADIIVTATGLKLNCLGGMQATVDGTPINLAGRLSHQRNDVSRRPELLLHPRLQQRLVDAQVQSGGRIYLPPAESHEQAHGYDCAAPVGREPAIVDKPAINLSSGYIRRGIEFLPKQGSKRPWKFHQNYALDMLDLMFSTIDDGTIKSFVSRMGGGRFSARVEHHAAYELFMAVYGSLRTTKSMAKATAPTPTTLTSPRAHAGSRRA